MKRSISAIILCFLLIGLSGCNIKDAYTIGKEKRNYINISYIDADTSSKSSDEAKTFLTKYKNQCVKWTIPVKSVLNNEYLILQAKDLCEVYAQFNYNFSKSAKFTSGKYVTVSGYLDSYCQSLLGEAPYWTLKNCRIESTSSTDEDELQKYLGNISGSAESSSQNGQTSGTDSTTAEASSSQESAMSLKVSDFKTQLIARDKNFAELPSFKDGGNEVSGDYYYTYETGETRSKYEVFLNAEDDKIYSVELVQNTTASENEKLRAQNVYNDILYVVYGNKDNADYKTAADFVKNFVTRNAKFNDFHIISSTIGDFKISLEMRSKTQEFRMIIEPK